MKHGPPRFWGLTAFLLVTAPIPAPAQAPGAPSEAIHSEGAPLFVVIRGSAAPAVRDWARLVRADLRLVDDVRLAPEGNVVLQAELVEGALHVTMTRDGEPLLSTEVQLDGPLSVRDAAHVSADQLLEALTGLRGPFVSSLVFVRRTGRRRDVLAASSDGSSVRRLSSGRASAMLPGVVGDDIWYSVLDDGRLYLTHTAADERPVIDVGGLSMGVAGCGTGLVFSSTRDGNSEIYAADVETLDVRRLTYHDAIDVSPTCHPSGEVAFVSSRTGMPQIHLLAPEALQPSRAAQPETHNQTPVFCTDPSRRLLAFTQVRRGMSVWTLDLDAGQAVRVSPPGRSAQDPSFSPDCRLLAYAAPDGLWLSSLDGARTRRVVRGSVQTVRWSPRPLAPVEP